MNIRRFELMDWVFFIAALALFGIAARKQIAGVVGGLFGTRSNVVVSDSSGVFVDSNPQIEFRVVPDSSVAAKTSPVMTSTPKVNTLEVGGSKYVDTTWTPDSVKSDAIIRDSVNDVTIREYGDFLPMVEHKPQEVVVAGESRDTIVHISSTKGKPFFDTVTVDFNKKTNRGFFTYFPSLKYHDGINNFSMFGLNGKQYKVSVGIRAGIIQRDYTPYLDLYIRTPSSTIPIEIGYRFTDSKPSVYIGVNKEFGL